MAKLDKITLPKGHKLIVTADVYSSGRFYEDSDQQTTSATTISPSETKIVTEDYSDRNFVLVSDTGRLTYEVRLDLDDQDSSEVPYDNTVSGLAATTIKGAIDELSALPAHHDPATLNADATTQETLNLVGQELQVNQATTLTDGAMSAEDKAKLDDIEANAKDDQTAAEVPYSNVSSGLTATDTQSAIDEVEARVDTAESNISTNTSNIANKQDDLSGLAITSATVVGADKVLIQDADDLDNLKTVTAQAIADLAAGGGATALDDLTDVTITTPASGQVLKYNGSAWINDTDATGTGGDAWSDPIDSNMSPAIADDHLFSIGQPSARMNTLYTGWIDADTEITTAGNIIVGGTVDGRDVAADGTKLDTIESNADVTDEANVTGALSGATLTSATVAGTDKVLIQDADDLDNLKTVTAQSIADLAAGGGGGTHTTVYDASESGAAVYLIALPGTHEKYRIEIYDLVRSTTVSGGFYISLKTDASTNVFPNYLVNMETYRSDTATRTISTSANLGPDFNAGAAPSLADTTTVPGSSFNGYMELTNANSNSKFKQVKARWGWTHHTGSDVIGAFRNEDGLVETALPITHIEIGGVEATSSFRIKIYGIN